MCSFNYMIINIGTYELYIDVEKTRDFYDNARFINEGCNCPGCRNYMAAVDSFPQEVIDFFSKLGVDLKKPAELMSPFSEDGGQTLQYWGGFYHICGELLSGDDCNAFEGEGVYHMDKTSFHQIIDGYSVGFSNYIDLPEDGFPEPVAQIDIYFTRIPWVLEEKNPYADNADPDSKRFIKNLFEKRKIKKQILMLLKMYANGEYDTTSFCTVFCNLYFFENDGRSLFFGNKRKVLEDFSTIAERYSNVKGDLIDYPDIYYDEEKVKEAFEIVKREFGI